jgi:hypothetical protein
MSQLSLLDHALRVERPWKRQRQTARTVYREQRAADVAAAEAGRETRLAQVLRILSWHWTSTQESPTAYELFEWARAHGEQLFDVNSVRPRLTKLLEVGLVDVVTDAGGRPVKRRCRHTGKRVCTWIVREAGSREAR